MGLFGGAQGWGGCRGGRGKKPLHKICHTYPTKMKLGLITPCLKNIQNIYDSRNALLEFCWNKHFFIGIQYILLYQKMQIWIAFWSIISKSSFNFFWVIKGFLKNMVKSLMESAKLPTTGFLIIKIFKNKSYGVTRKIFSRGSNYIVEVVMWPKFGNSSISITEVITTSIL